MYRIRISERCATLAPIVAKSIKENKPNTPQVTHKIRSSEQVMKVSGKSYEHVCCCASGKRARKVLAAATGKSGQPAAGIIVAARLLVASVNAFQKIPFKNNKENSKNAKHVSPSVDNM